MADHNQLNFITNDDTIGHLFKGGSWLSEEKYIPVTRVFMLSSAGLKGEPHVEIIERTSLENLKSNYLVTKSWDGKAMILNLKYMVSAEQLAIVERSFGISSCERSSRYVCRWLIPDGKVITFVDEYQDY